MEIYDLAGAIVEYPLGLAARWQGGKAMVVTRSRLHAVRYRLEFERYIKEKGYDDLKVLVAFSGTVIDPDTKHEFTEAGMNNFGERELPERFGGGE